MDRCRLMMILRAVGVTATRRRDDVAAIENMMEEFDDADDAVQNL